MLRTAILGIGAAEQLARTHIEGPEDGKLATWSSRGAEIAKGESRCADYSQPC